MAETKQKQCIAGLEADAPAHHQLCEMFWTLGPAFARWTEQCLKGNGKSPQRVRLMAHLYKNGPVKMGDLRTELGVTATCITALVDQLEAEGLVTRKPHKTDRRATLVKLTRSAEKQLEGQCGPFKDQVAEVFASFSGDEQKRFLSLLGRVRAALTEQGILK